MQTYVTCIQASPEIELERKKIQDLEGLTESHR